MCDTHECVICVHVWHVWQISRTEIYTTFGQICNACLHFCESWQDLRAKWFGGIGRCGCSKNPVNLGNKFSKCGKHGTKFSRRFFTHRGGTCNAPFIVLPLVGRSARSAGKSPSWAGAKVTYRSEDEEWREVGDFWGFSRRRKSQKSTTSRHLFIWGSFARGESKPCRSSTLSRDLFTLTD